MNRKLSTTLAAGATAAAISLGGIAAAPAFAYPPGTGLQVSTSLTPIPLNPSSFTVTVSQAKPGSNVTVRINRVGRNHTLLTGRAIADANGKATFTFKIYGGQQGQITVKATASDAGYKEKATTTVAILGRTITAPTTVDKGETFEVTVTGYTKKKRITITAVRGKTKVSVSGRTDAAGNFTGELTLNKSGTWAIIATSRGRATVTTVVVD
jgi:predicted RNA-binding protein with TRAM domain